MDIFEAYRIMTDGGTMRLQDYSYYQDPANAASLIAQATAKLAEQQPVVQEPVAPVVQEPVVQEPVAPVVQEPVAPVVQDPVASTTMTQQDYIDKYGPTNFTYTTYMDGYFDTEGNRIQDPNAFLAAKRAYDKQRADEAVEDPVVEDSVDTSVDPVLDTVPKVNTTNVDEVKEEVKEEVKKDESQAEGTESIASTPDAYNRTFARDVTDFFLRTVNRLPSQGEIEAYKKNYFIPDQKDYSFSKLDQEQAKKDLMDERVSTFGLPSQIDELYKRAFGKGPTAQESTDAAEFFNKIGQYTTDPRKITAPDAQRFKEQVITPQQLSKIPVNVSSPSNLPTTFLTSPTKSVSDFAITGGVSPLPTDAPTTPPVPTSITPDTDVYSEAYFRDKFLPQEDSDPVGLHSGGDPVVEMMRKKQTPQTRAREDLNRILGK